MSNQATESVSARAAAGDVTDVSNASLWLAGIFAAAPVLVIFVAMKVVRLTGGKE